MVNITTPLMIIGAALPRTGTASIKTALEQIGYKVFHALEYSAEYSAIWNQYVQADMVAKNEDERKGLMDAFVQLLSRDGFNVTLDQPSCFVFRELMDYYPNAKVLLTQRDAKSWARSVVEMSHCLDTILFKPPYDRHPDKIDGPFGNWSKTQQGIRRDEVHVDGIKDSKNPLERKSSVSLATCERAYYEYQDRVRQNVPSEKLVEYSVKDGWEPLCDNFLPQGRRCPSDEPFPRTNTAETSFLLAFRREARIRTIMHRIHPRLSGKCIGKLIYRIRYESKWILYALAVVCGAIAGAIF